MQLSPGHKQGTNKVLNSNWEDQSNNNQQSTNSNQQPLGTTKPGHGQQQQPNTSKTVMEMQSTTTPGTSYKSTVGQVVIPYTKGVVESFKHICGKYGIKVHFKGNTTVKTSPYENPRTRTPRTRRVGSSTVSNATT